MILKKANNKIEEEGRFPRVCTQSSFFLSSKNNPTKAGKRIFIIKRKIDALNATDESSPNEVKKNT
ncbi:MAG: hypothetical protein O6940_05385, partial [Ignavibacteria bacterium]|nr:hypothetical protein [Ignavibacteria bacterium]